jgi:predicted transcriptional regulator
MNKKQLKVLETLTKDEPQTRSDLVEKTQLDYDSVNKSLIHLVEVGRAACTRINGVKHYHLSQEWEIPMETTTARAIRVQPWLHSVWAVA